MLHETGATCNSITFDGAAVNISMRNTLSCNFGANANQFKPWFEHPLAKEKVFVFFDACHMLKLIRNAFGTKRVFIDEDIMHVKWSYLEALHELQENGVKSWK